MQASPLYAIPLELRQLKQFILWKDDKVPYQTNGQLASVTDPSHWSTFDECFNCLQMGNWKGIGFVFTENDPYTFIDLDNPQGDAAILERQLKVFHEFNSYAEISPSGMGLHIIVKGNVAAGRRRSKIEVYSSGRYATMTGNVYDNRNVINDCQNQLTQLWTQMGAGQAAQSVYKGDEKELYLDDEIITKARNASNGDKFQQLYSGEWNGNYPSQSEADLALIDIIAFYTQNRSQIQRIFQLSGLGRRNKAKRGDYLNWMINKSFDRLVPNIDFDSSYNAVAEKLGALRNGSASGFGPEGVGSIPSAPANNGSVAQRSVPAAHNSKDAGSNPATSTTLPPGLLGEIAQFIYQAAPRPVPEIALAAAIGLMAGITGRAYNVSGTGLNQYVLLLAMTGAGKEAAASGINKLMNTIKMQVPTSTTFIGPSEISSGAALFKHLGNTSQSFVSLLGEFGLRLHQMSSPNANGSEVSLRRMFLDLYNKSGVTDTLHASIYSDKANNTNAVNSPSFSILGESTPEKFYGALNEDMISEGLLPRFLMIEYKGNRPQSNKDHALVTPSFQLIERLASLAAQCETINHANPRRPINVLPDEATSLKLQEFDALSDAKINGSNKDVIRQLWNRAHLKVMKLAALIAVGVNPIDPVIKLDHYEWAVALIKADIQNLTEKFEAGEIGANTLEVRQNIDIIRIIKDYNNLPYEKLERYLQFKSPKMHQDKVIPYIYLNKRLAPMSSFRLDKSGATVAIKRAIQNLVDSDRIKELGKIWCSERYGTSQRAFIVADLSILD